MNRESGDEDDEEFGDEDEFGDELELEPLLLQLSFGISVWPAPSALEPSELPIELLIELPIECSKFDFGRFRWNGFGEKLEWRPWFW